MDRNRGLVLLAAGLLVGLTLGAFEAETLAPARTTTTFVSLQGYDELACVATSYFVPDTIAIEVGTTTQTSGSSTFTSVLTIVLSSAATTTDGLFSYTSATNSSETLRFVVTTTSNDLNDVPSDGWTVATCTYLP